MRSDNLQLPCVQLPASSYNFQLPHGCHGHHGRHGHGGHGGHVAHGGRGEHGVVVMNMVVMVTGRDGTGKTAIKLHFPGNL